MPLLIVLSILAAVAGVLSLSQATLGVGIIGLACYLGILARITQSTAQIDRIMGSVARTREAVEALLEGERPDALQS